MATTKIKQSRLLKKINVSTSEHNEHDGIPARMFFMNQVDFKVLSDATERIFFFAVFATVNWRFPFITKGNSLVILGPLEVIKFYMSIPSTIALGLTLPFLMHFLWSFVKPGLKKEESR